MPRRLAFLRRMRLVRPGDFTRAFKTGGRSRGAVMVVVVCPNGLAHSRLGLSVGKAIWKRAVGRNRVRRIFREAFRLSYQELPQGFDIVLIPAAARLDPTLDAARAELVALVPRALRRLEQNARAAQAAARAKPRTETGGA